MFKSIFDLNVVHVPYKGTAPALQDIVGGHVQFMFADVPPAKALVLGGKVRALGRHHHRTRAGLPDLPTLAEPASRASTPHHGIRSRRPQACRRTSSTSSPVKFAR